MDPINSDDPVVSSRTEQIRAQAAVLSQRQSGGMSLLSVCILILTILAVFYTLYFTADIVLPFVLAGVLNLLLSGPMRFLHNRLRIPKPLSALLLIVLLFGVVGAIGAAISVPASGWISKAPESLPALQHKLSFLNQPIHAVQSGIQKLSALFESTGGSGGGRVLTVQQAGNPGLTSVGSTILVGTRAFLGQAFSMLPPRPR